MNREVAFPAWWWGPFAARTESTPLFTLIESGMLDHELSDLLKRVIEAGASVVVCAGHSGAGKTTLLTALTEFVRHDRSAFFVRGRYEQFDAVQQPAASSLLINEISDHLPLYLWGPALARAHELAAQGAQLMTTAHADSTEEFIGQLTMFPNNVPVELLACWTLLIFLDAWIENRAVRREIRLIESLVLDENGQLAVVRLAARGLRGGALGKNREAWAKMPWRRPGE